MFTLSLYIEISVYTFFRLKCFGYEMDKKMLIADDSSSTSSIENSPPFKRFHKSRSDPCLIDVPDDEALMGQTAVRGNRVSFDEQKLYQGMLC